MVRLFARPSVIDYAAWRMVFDDVRETRRQAGVIGEEVYRSSDNPNDVTLNLDFATLEAARAFPANAALKSALTRAGAPGSLSAWNANRA